MSRRKKQKNTTTSAEKPEKTRHYFFLNPYEDCAFTKCPKCNNSTKVRKFPLVIHIEPLQFLVLNKNCKYCINGYVPFSKAGSELLFEVVSRAYEHQSLIITTNLPFESWTEVCGSERLTGAMLDRLTHKVHIIEANGASYRLEQSRRRLARRKKTTE